MAKFNMLMDELNTLVVEIIMLMVEFIILVSDLKMLKAELNTFMALKAFPAFCSVFTVAMIHDFGLDMIHDFVYVSRLSQHSVLCLQKP